MITETKSAIIAQYDFPAVFSLAGIGLTANLQFNWHLKRVITSTNQLIPHMKLVFIAAFAAVFSASCCPSAPAPSKPAYAMPSK